MAQYPVISTYPGTRIRGMLHCGECLRKLSLNDFMERMGSPTLNGIHIGGDKDAQEDAENANVDRPWREAE